MDNTVTDQTSVLRFIEDNWLNGERITGSFDAYANSIVQMFDFKHRNGQNSELILDPLSGQPVRNQPKAEASGLR